MAQMVSEAIDQLGLESATLVGNDTGTAVCQIAATRHHDHVDGLVLTSGDYAKNSPATLFKFVPVVGRIPGAMLMYLGPAALVPIRPMYRLPVSFGWLIKHPPGRDVMDTYFHPTIRDRAIRKDMRSFARAYTNPAAIEAARALPRFDKPVLLAWSREDRFFPAKHAKELARVLPDARLHWIDDSYTISAEDQPERLAELIAAFMDERAGGPVSATASTNGSTEAAATSNP
jgi:pimeloyl-ACP methyl ester carboxylesterase